MGRLHRDMQRPREAEGQYQEALQICRALAVSEPEAYSRYVAETLKDLAALYRGTQRVKEAEAYCIEAEQILTQSSSEDPEVHGDQMAKVLCERAELCAPLGKNIVEACAFARRALEIAEASEVRSVARELVRRFCAHKGVKKIV